MLISLERFKILPLFLVFALFFLLGLGIAALSVREIRSFVFSYGQSLQPIRTLIWPAYSPLEQGLRKATFEPAMVDVLTQRKEQALQLDKETITKPQLPAVHAKQDGSLNRVTVQSAILQNKQKPLDSISKLIPDKAPPVLRVPLVAPLEPQTAPESIRPTPTELSSISAVNTPQANPERFIRVITKAKSVNLLPTVTQTSTADAETVAEFATLSKPAQIPSTAEGQGAEQSDDSLRYFHKTLPANFRADQLVIEADKQFLHLFSGDKRVKSYVIELVQQQALLNHASQARPLFSYWIKGEALPYCALLLTDSQNQTQGCVALANVASQELWSAVPDYSPVIMLP